MTAPTLTETDSKIDSAFGELECVSQQETPHGGDVAAYMILHTCVEGWVCKAHYDRWLANMYPHNMEVIAMYGYIRCPVCQRTYPTLDAYQKVMPL